MSSSYIGAEPLDTYSSLAVQHFTTSATTSYSLSQSVTSENDIRLTINSVVQQPGSSYAYTCSGTTLTLVLQRLHRTPCIAFSLGNPSAQLTRPMVVLEQAS